MLNRTSDDRPVAAYLAGLDVKDRAALQRLQEIILEVAPDAVEALSYGMAAFKLDGKPIAAFAAFEHHLSFSR